jgi:hypothetical protein
VVAFPILGYALHVVVGAGHNFSTIVDSAPAHMMISEKSYDTVQKGTKLHLKSPTAERRHNDLNDLNEKMN